jgi:hydroxyacylglutathione hydrolase
LLNRVVLSALVAISAASAQTSIPQQPSGVEPGTLPASWITGGPNCLEVPDWQVHEYNPTFYILRESGCTNYEKPFLYLIFGKDRALLIDTGAGPVDTAAFVQKLIAKWCKTNKREAIPLTVVHTHAHGDHVAGDKGFEGMPNVTLIPAGSLIKGREGGIIELGDRIVDVLAIPGHQAAHVAYYDRKTGILHTGDHLYPGRLYVQDFPAYLESTLKLVRFTDGKPIAHIVGCHIEQTSTPFVDYPIGTTYQPQEHALTLSRGHLLELLAGLESMREKPVKLALRDFTIFPRQPQATQNDRLRY